MARLLPGLDDALLTDFFREHRRLGARTAPGFVMGWTAFNHIYGAYWDSAPPPGPGGDKRQVLQFATYGLAQECFRVAATSHASQFSLELPLVDRQGNHVPPDLLTPGNHKASGLSFEQYLRVVYEIRNSFVHGSRRPRNLDGQKRIAFAESFGEFLKLLMQKVAPAVRA
jgi:hypothetical protein